MSESKELKANMVKYLAAGFIIAGLIIPSICSAEEVKTKAEDYRAYLMAYFGPEEKLYYAYSFDARNWTPLNNGEPLPWSPPFVRDPFLNRADGKFHLVHTTGWSGTTIGHLESSDLINWTGGKLEVVETSKERCWAPEFFYLPDEDLFYVFWASVHDGHNAIHYATTKNWDDITPGKSDVYYDIGIHDIDLTIAENNGTYYGFHKPGDVQDEMGNRLSTSTTLDPNEHTFGENGYGADILPDQTKPTEGPQVIKLIGKEKWLIYADPFHKPMEAWQTSDFKNFTRISVNPPEGAKHCSIIPITRNELNRLLDHYTGDKIRVMSFNIKYDTKSGNGAWDRDRRERVCKMILSESKAFKATAPDIIGIQEAMANQAKDLKAALTNYEYYGVGRRGDGTGEQCAIYYKKSRFSILDKGTFWLSETPGKPGSRHPAADLARIASWVRLESKTGGDTYFVLNTHWSHISDKANEYSARLIHRKIRELAGKDDSLIVLGDLNTYENEKAFEILTGSGEDRLLCDSFRGIHPVKGDNEASFHGWEGGTKGRRIDFILYRNLTPENAGIETARIDGRYPSDHYPVTATFRSP